MRRTQSVAFIAAGTAMLVGIAMVWRWWGAISRDDGAVEFTGSARCGSCHAVQRDGWKASQHAAAKQEARPGTVLGRFETTRFTQNGITSTFFRRGDRFFVHTEGPDGGLRDFEVRSTFGVYPIQQYLVELTRGRVQALTIAWDAREASRGGQRWFSLTPGGPISHTDELHWTGRAFNWNYMCADCHSTAVRKGYGARTDAFRTTRSEISVGCEACHGPGSRHVAWAQIPSWVRRVAVRDNRLANSLVTSRAARWALDSGLTTARRLGPATDREIDTCAQCHASRAHIADGYTAGAPLMDYYIPSLLTSDGYFPDGQQRDEVYDYGSFLQSRMYRAGVTCSDCHDPHNQRLRRPGNQVCGQCHRPGAYDTAAHHFHRTGTSGAQCASCHLPDTAYMEIDPRHDHSIRIPRPDQSALLGVPNACNRCHIDRDARWAARQVRAWYGTTPHGFQRFAEAFAADDRGDRGAADSLRAVFSDSTEPAIVRASALARLNRHPEQATFEAVRLAADDPHPLVRLAALQALEAFVPQSRITTAVPLLGDPTRAVRQGAAWLLAPVSGSLTTPLQRHAFAAAAAEFVASQRYNADQPGNRMALGAFYAQLGQLDSAAIEFRAATRLAPRYDPAYTALAAILRAQGRMNEANRVLDSARGRQERR